MDMEKLRKDREELYQKNQRLFVKRARIQKEIKEIIYAENITEEMEIRKARLTKIRDKIDYKRAEIRKKTLYMTELEFYHNLEN